VELTLLDKILKLSLVLKITIGLVIGSVLALVCPGHKIIILFGTLFVGTLKAIAPILVFFLVTAALAKIFKRIWKAV